MKVTHFAWGYIATNAQIKVVRTKSISTAARRLLRKPNWIGVKMRLNIMLSINGSKTKKEILFVKYR
jgi:hypothetical protein